MPNITYKINDAINCLYYYPQKVCNFHKQVFQIKLKYHCCKPIKLQKFLMQQYNNENLDPLSTHTSFQNNFTVLRVFAETFPTNMKPSECLAKDTNGEGSKKEQEKEQRVSRFQISRGWHLCKNILWSILCPCPNYDIPHLSEHFQNFYTFLSLGLFIHQKFSCVLFSTEHEYLKLK